MDTNPRRNSRLLQAIRNWQDPCWDFRPLSDETSWAYRAFVVVGVPVLAAAAIALMWLVGVDLHVQSWPLVGAVLLLTAVLSTVLLTMDDNVAADPVTALPMALLLAGEPTGAVLAAVVSMIAYGIRVPMPLHVTLGLNALGCGVWLTATTAIVFHVAVGEAQVGSARWFGAAFVAVLVHSLGCFVPVQFAALLRGERSAREAIASQLDITRTEMTTLAVFTMLAGAIMAGGAWWTALFAAAPLLMAWETYVRTSQYVQARSDAYHDALTGLLNRRALEQRLGGLLGGEHSELIWVMLCDLDNFKQLNDVHGHHVGDAALVKAAAALRDSVRAGDICARLGGEEFVVALRGVDVAMAETIAGRVLHRCREELSPLGSSVSIGLYHAAAGDDIDAALQRADQAMYVSKRSGKDRATFWTEQCAEAYQSDEDAPARAA